MEQILDWPWRRFEAFYTAFIKRQVVESLERRKDQMVSALWANEGFNDDKGSRLNAINEIEGHYAEAIQNIMGNRHEVEKEIDPDNPFFKPTMQAMKKLDERMDQDGTVAERVKQEADFGDIDQA